MNIPADKEADLDTKNMTQKPNLPDLQVGGQKSAIELQAKVQRCESEGKSGKNCNILNTSDEQCVLKVEPLPQWDFPDEGSRGLNQQILLQFYGADEQAQSSNPNGWPDALYRKWGSAVLASNSNLYKNVGCGLTSLTMVLRYLKKEGETQSLYDKIVAALIQENPKDNAPLLAGSKKLWIHSEKQFYKFWHPVWVLWWIRNEYQITKKAWKSNFVLTPKGILNITAWKEKIEDDSKVPDALLNLGLCMVEGRRKNRVQKALAEIKAALDEGYPVITLRPGHFVLVVGYTKNEKGLRFIINDPGLNPLQYVIDPWKPYVLINAKGGSETVSNAVPAEGESKQGKEEAKRALQRVGYHITNLKSERLIPKKKKEGKDYKEYTFEWDWRIKSFWWDQHWVIKFQEAKVKKELLKLKIPSTKPASVSGSGS